MSGPDTSPDRPAERPIVLVVDDAPSSLGLLCDMLEANGFTVLVAGDGETALQRLELVVPDAILLDAVMPGWSGFDTCRRIKADPALAHIPVLFMTGLSETSDIVEGFDAGGVDYVVKPLREAEVLARLHTHVRNARITRLARDAVDVAGMGVAFVDSLGRIAWRSPLATNWLVALSDSTASTNLPAQLRPLMAPGAALTLPTSSGLRLHVRNLGTAALGESVLLFTPVADQGNAAAATERPTSRLTDAALTPRETEVLAWVAKGKTNRDIAEILTLSPRTVNKHLEHVFEKLGVETRAAAAALASRHAD